MMLFMFVVEFDAVQWVPDELELGSVKHGGTRRERTEFNVVAESQALAEAEVVNDRNFYHHQNPRVTLAQAIPVHQLVLVERRRV